MRSLIRYKFEGAGGSNVTHGRTHFAFSQISGAMLKSLATYINCTSLFILQFGVNLSLFKISYEKYIVSINSDSLIVELKSQSSESCVNLYPVGYPEEVYRPQ